MKKLTTDEFIVKAKLVHGDKYNYSMVNYIDNKTKVNIVCNEHGIFKQRPTRHLYSDGCSKYIINSKGELHIIEWLNENNIPFITQKSFSDCKNDSYLRFDFWIEKHNLLIEYDGVQHYKPRKFFGGESGFRTTQINDKIKTEYALNNGYNILRIPYTERMNLSGILENNIIIK
jgi:very-short-patch-repair endonuclease